MEDLYRSVSCEPLAQKLAGKLSFARGTAAQRVKQRKEFAEHGVIARSERRCWIQRMKANTALVTVSVRPDRRQFTRVRDLRDKRSRCICSRSSTGRRSQRRRERVLSSMKEKFLQR